MFRRTTCLECLPSWVWSEAWTLNCHGDPGQWPSPPLPLSPPPPPVPSPAVWSRLPLAHNCMVIVKLVESICGIWWVQYQTLVLWRPSMGYKNLKGLYCIIIKLSPTRIIFKNLLPCMFIVEVRGCQKDAEELWPVSLERVEALIARETAVQEWGRWGWWQRVESLVRGRSEYRQHNLYQPCKTVFTITITITQKSWHDTHKVIIFVSHYPNKVAFTAYGT